MAYEYNTCKEYEDSIRDIYGDSVKIGFIEYDTVEAIKELDPIAFSVGHDDFHNGRECGEDEESEAYVTE